MLSGAESPGCLALLATIAPDTLTARDSTGLLPFDLSTCSMEVDLAQSLLQREEEMDEVTRALTICSLVGQCPPEAAAASFPGVL